MAPQLNVVLICTDQQFAGAMSCVGNDEINTPAMDRLAAEGTRFSESYCTSPLCTPSRTSMLTGRMPHETGITVNGGSLPESYHSESLGALFNNAGYDCGWAGKWHAAFDQIGFESLVSKNDPAVVEESVSFIDREREGPFCLGLSFDDPHNICEYGRGQNPPWGHIEEPPIEACPSLPANFAVPPYEPTTIRPTLSQNLGTIGAMSDASPDEWRRYRNAYYRMVERVDEEIGRFLDALNQRGHLDDTVIVFLSDHGDGVGAHRINQKNLLYEEPTRVPFVIRPPDRSPANLDALDDGSRGRVDDHLVSTGLDLIPTLCEYAGIDPPADLRGHSLRPLVRNNTPDNWREFLITETETPLSGRMVRTERYKYILYASGRHREQLFDMQTDRGELVDLSVNTAYDDVLDEHRRRLLRWSKENNDVFASRYDSSAPLIPGFDLEAIGEFMRDGPEPTGKDTWRR